jgi:hypothetical protein
MAAKGNLPAGNVTGLASLSDMPRRKRRTKQEPKAVPAAEPVAKIKKRRRRRRPVAKSVPVTAEPKTLMQLIFEAQRTELDRLNEALRTRVFEG